MSDNFQKITDQATNDLVNGYVKEQQLVFPFAKTANYTIPLVQHLIATYFHAAEFFTTHGSLITLNEKSNTLTFNDNETEKCSSTPCTVYGNIRIDDKMHCNKFLWEFKIISANDMVCIGIGIDSSNKEYTNTMFDSSINKYPYYSFESIKIVTGLSQILTNDSSDDYGSFYCKPNSVVKMELDTNNKTLRYYVNGADQGIAVDNVKFDNNEQYVAAISVNKNVKIKLLKFEQKYQENNIALSTKLYKLIRNLIF